VLEAGAGVAVTEESPQAASSTSKKENNTRVVRGRKRRLKITLFIKLTSISLSPFNQASLSNKLFPGQERLFPFRDYTGKGSEKVSMALIYCCQVKSA
jgi:hypothetical protein